MDSPPLSQEARATLDSARETASGRGSEDPEGVDILVALLHSDEAVTMLELFDEEPGKLGAALQLMKGVNALPSDRDAEQRVVDLARAEAGRLGHQETGPDHLLLALIREPGSLVGGLLSSVGLTVHAGRQALRYLYGQAGQWERPANPDMPSRVTSWAPMDAVPMEEVPAWVRERADQIEEAMSNVEVGLERLDRVISIGQVVESSAIVVELIVLEVRETGAVLLWRTRSEDERLLGSPQMTIADDIGTAYTVFPMAWSGGGRESRGETVVTPRPPDTAGRLVIEVRSFEDADWMVAPWADQFSTGAVLGPWRFEIPLGP